MAPALPANEGSESSSGSDTQSDSGKVHQFNEQTNYVPKRTIITVRCLVSVIVSHETADNTRSSWLVRVWTFWP